MKDLTFYGACASFFVCALQNEKEARMSPDIAMRSRHFLLEKIITSLGFNCLQGLFHGSSAVSRFKLLIIKLVLCLLASS